MRITMFINCFKHLFPNQRHVSRHATAQSLIQTKDTLNNKVQLQQIHV